MIRPQQIAYALQRKLERAIRAAAHDGSLEEGEEFVATLQQILALCQEHHRSQFFIPEEGIFPDDDKALEIEGQIKQLTGE